MRLFIAIPLPPHARRAALAAQHALIAAGAEGRFVPDENFHITLRFIGESERLADIAQAMQDAARDIRPCLLRLSGYDAFSQGEGRTAHISIAYDEEFQRLYESLDYALSARGFPSARSRLIPHITLGRHVQGDEGFDWHDPKASFLANEIVLYESRRVDGSMRYSAIHRERFA